MDVKEGRELALDEVKKKLGLLEVGQQFVISIIELSMCKGLLISRILGIWCLSFLRIKYVS